MERWGLSVGVIALGMAAIGLPYTVPNMPAWLGIGLFWAGSLGVVIGALIGTWDTPPAVAARRSLGWATESPRVAADMTLREAGQHVIEVLGVADANAGFAFTELRQAARNGDIQVWGREEMSKPYAPIPREYWRTPALMRCDTSLPKMNTLFGSRRPS